MTDITDENKGDMGAGITDTDWMEASMLNEISEMWDQVKEGLPGYQNTKGARLAAVLAHLTVCDYVVKSKQKHGEIGKDGCNPALRAELAVLQSKIELADKIIREILEEDYFYADPVIVTSGPDDEATKTLPFWMEGSVFEEIYNALRQELYTPIVKEKTGGVKWEHFGYLTPLQKATYYVTNEYARRLNEMGSEGLIADGEYPSPESREKRKMMESRFAVAGTFLVYLMKEATVSLTGRYAIIFTACDEPEK